MVPCKIGDKWWYPSAPVRELVRKHEDVERKVYAIATRALAEPDGDRRALVDICTAIEEAPK